jgi:hypothetical protein
MALRLVQDQHETLQVLPAYGLFINVQGLTSVSQRDEQLPAFNKVREWPHEASLPEHVTKRGKWAVDQRYASLRRMYGMVSLA